MRLGDRSPRRGAGRIRCGCYLGGPLLLLALLPQMAVSRRPLPPTLPIFAFTVTIAVPRAFGTTALPPMMTIFTGLLPLTTLIRVLPRALPLVVSVVCALPLVMPIVCALPLAMAALLPTSLAAGSLVPRRARRTIHILLLTRILNLPMRPICQKCLLSIWVRARGASHESESLARFACR